MEEQSRLSIGQLRIVLMNIIHDVAVGSENIFPAVQVVIEKQATERQAVETILGDAHRIGSVHEKRATSIVIETQHFRGKISNHETCVTGAIVIGEIHSHPSPSLPVPIQCHAGIQSHLSEGPVLVVAE